MLHLDGMGWIGGIIDHRSYKSTFGANKIIMGGLQQHIHIFSYRISILLVVESLL